MIDEASIRALVKKENEKQQEKIGTLAWFQRGYIQGLRDVLALVEKGKDNERSK